VVIPEAGIINHTQKAARTFAQFDAPAAGYVVSRVIPHELQEVIRPAGALKGDHRCNGVGPLPLFSNVVKSKHLSRCCRRAKGDACGACYRSRF